MKRITAKPLSIAMALIAALLLGSFAPEAAQAQARPLRNVPVSGLIAGAIPFNGKLSITEFALGDEGLLASGRVTGVLGRQRINQAFSGVPIALVASGAGGEPTSGGVSTLALSPDEPLVCDILFLDLAPLHLDLLGLQLDLAEVILDLDAVSGPGALVGNLLCAVTGLLDVVPLGVLLQGILEAVLDALNGLL